MAARNRSLTKEKVVAAAVRLANDSGSVDKVTLAELAANLQIRTPSLYNHIDGLGGLQHDLALYAGRDLLRRMRKASFGLTGRDALMTMASTYRRFAFDQPGLYTLTVIAPDAQDEELTELAQEWLQTLLLIMASLNLHGQDALHAIRGFRALLHGFISLEALGGFKMALDRDQSFELLLNTYLDGLGK